MDTLEAVNLVDKAMFGAHDMQPGTAGARCDTTQDVSERLPHEDRIYSETASRGTAIGLAYHDSGRVDHAIAQFEANLNTEETAGELQESTWAGRDDVVSNRNNLAAAYLEANRIPEAIDQFETNLREAERLLGPDRPETLVFRNNLALVLGEAGATTRAVTLHEMNLVAYERLFGVYHPDTHTSRINVAVACATGRTMESTIPLRVNLSGPEPSRGVDHPDTVINRNNLAAAVEAVEVDGGAV